MKTLRVGARQEWLSLHEHLQQYDSLSPFDEVRIIVVLDNKAIQAVPEEKRQLLHRVGIETQAKWSWLNHSEMVDTIINGSKIVSKSSEYLRDITPLLNKIKLTSSERSIVTQSSGKEIWERLLSRLMCLAPIRSKVRGHGYQRIQLKPIF